MTKTRKKTEKQIDEHQMQAHKTNLENWIKVSKKVGN